MRFRADAGWRRLLAVALMTMALCSSVLSARRQDLGGQPGTEEIRRALQSVASDPNLGGERHVTTLRWRGTSGNQAMETPSWFHWVIQAAEWFDTSARFLMWGVLIAAVGGLVAFIVHRFNRPGADVRDAADRIAPTHVRDFDIRPESLPPDIGAAARALWEQKSYRSSLALLYRGMLSRLVHVHHVPIRDSSTEGECVDLAANRVALDTRRYASELIRTWLRAVYGHEVVDHAEIEALCEGFGAAMDHASTNVRVGGGVPR